MKCVERLHILVINIWARSGRDMAIGQVVQQIWSRFGENMVKMRLRNGQNMALFRLVIDKDEKLSVLQARRID